MNHDRMFRKRLQKAADDALPLLIGKLPGAPTGFCRAINVGWIQSRAWTRRRSAAIRGERPALTLQIKQLEFHFAIVLVFRQTNPAWPIDSPDYCREPGANAFPFKEAAFRIQTADTLHPSRFPFPTYQQREDQRGAAVVQGEDHVGLRHCKEATEQMQLGENKGEN